MAIIGVPEKVWELPAPVDIPLEDDEEFDSPIPVEEEEEILV